MIKVFIVFADILPLTTVNTTMENDILNQIAEDQQSRMRTGIYERDLYRWEDLNFTSEFENVSKNDLDLWMEQYKSTGVVPEKIIVDGNNLDYALPVNDYPFKFAYLPKDLLWCQHRIKECDHKIPNTHFNFMAGNYHTARFLLLEKLWKQDLLDKMYWSLYRHSWEEEYFDENFIKFIKQNTPRTFKTDRFYNSYPEDIGLTTTEKSFIPDYNNSDTWIYENSLISIVIDTFSTFSLKNHKDTGDGPCTTAKTFKAIKQKRPFILTMGKTGGDLTSLKNLGFETFDSVWDESYDNYGFEKRLDHISDLCYNLSNENITDLYNKTVDICEHNYNVLMNTDWVQWYFDILDKQNE